MSTSPRSGVQRGWVLAVVAVVVAATTAAVVLWVSPRVFDRKAGLTPSRGLAENEVEEIEGSVKEVEQDTRTVLVSSGILGLGATPLALSDDTRVFVGEKEGAFGDLREGTRVRASYEVRRDTRVARVIEVLRGNETPRRRETVRPRPATVETPSAAAPAPPAPSPPPAADVLRSPNAAPPTRAPAAPVTNTSTAGQTPKPPAEARAQRLPTPLRAQPHPVSRTPLAGASETRLTGPPTSRPTPSIATPPSPEVAREREGADPAAVIDWLLKERR